MRCSGLFVVLMSMSGVAEAADSRVSASVGLETVINDPFVRRNGARLAVGYAITPRLSVAASGTYYPDLGRGDWTAATRALQDEFRVSPDISRVLGRTGVALEVVPLHNELPGGGSSEIGLRLGIGTVRTHDDLALAQREGDTLYMATEWQWHPNGSAALVGRISLSRRASFCGVWEVFSYIENVGDSLQMKNNEVLGAELAWSF